MRALAGIWTLWLYIAAGGATVDGLLVFSTFWSSSFPVSQPKDPPADRQIHRLAPPSARCNSPPRGDTCHPPAPSHFSDEGQRIPQGPGPEGYAARSRLRSGRDASPRTNKEIDPDA